MKSTRTEILEVAERVFSVSGYRATSLDEIAQRIGITRQALYHYFPRKVDVLIELNRNVIHIFNRNADRVFAEEEGHGGRELLFTALLRAHLRTVAENVPLVTLFLKELGNVPNPEHGELNTLRRAYQERFVSAYRAGVREGQLRDVDPRVAVNVLLGAANQLTLWYSPDGEISQEEIPELTLEFLRAGYLCSDAPRARPESSDMGPVASCGSSSAS